MKTTTPVLVSLLVLATAGCAMTGPKDRGGSLRTVPPDAQTVDIPEIEGLRLVVSVRGGGEVHVVQSSVSTAGGGLQPFMEELQGVLENRGFVMTGDGRRRGHNPQQEEQPLPRRTQQPTFRRPDDNDLRI